MVRFIFACMVLVALSLLAAPLTGIYDGINDQRTVTVATNTQSDTQPAEDEDIFALDETASPSADDLNAIATAAGGHDDSIEPGTTNFGGGFSGQAPSALAPDAAASVTTPETPEAN